MPKTLYVRKFSDHLHNQLNDIAENEGITVGSILEESFREYIKHKQEIPSKHHLVLYTEKDALLHFLRKMEELTKDDWTRICLGPESNEGQKFLKKKGWIDVTISPYYQGIKQPEEYSSKVFDRAADIASGKKAIFLGSLTGDVAGRFSLKKANELEKISNSKRSKGIAFCPYDMKNLNGASFTEILDLINEHEKAFVLKDKEIYELNLSQTSHFKTLI